MKYSKLNFKFCDTCVEFFEHNVNHEDGEYYNNFGNYKFTWKIKDNKILNYNKYFKGKLKWEIYCKNNKYSLFKKYDNNGILIVVLKNPDLVKLHYKM